MERRRDSRRTTISPANGLPRRRQRITTLRDSPDKDSQMELQERSIDRERFQKKDQDQDREISKRRRVDKSGVQQRICGGEGYKDNESTDSSDEEYYEEKEERQNRMNQPLTPSSSLCNNRRVLRTLRSSPVLRAVADEMIGVPIPRRARSAKRLHEYRNSGSDGIGENLNHRRFSPTPAPGSRIVSDGPSPPSSGVSMKKKKKMKSVQPRARILNGVSSSRLSSGIQDDIEIEVAEALFDLMKQSQSQSKKQENVDRDGRNTSDDVQNEQSIKVNDSMEELKKEKFPGQELVSRDDGFVNKGNVGSPKEIESPSCVKVNACDIQYPTVTKAEYAAAVVETKKEAKLEIDLMAFPPLPSSPEIDALVDIATDPKVTTHDVQKKIEAISRDSSVSAASQLVDEKIGAISCNQQQRDWKEQKNQPPLSFPIGMSGWPGVFPYPGYMLPPQAVLPIEESARTSTVMQLPRFKFSQPRSRRCATHQYIAQNIHHHQQLIKKSLSSGPTGAATSYETKPLNLKSLSPKQKVIPGNQLLGDIQNWATISGGSGKDKSSNIAADFTTTSNKLVLQQAPHQAPPNNVLPQTTAIGNTSLPCNSAGRPSMSFNHPIFPSNEAASYMAMLQNNGCSVPISTNIPISSLKGSQSSAMPFFNSSFYSSRPFNVSQNMSTPSGSTSHKQPKHTDNNYPTSATTPLQQPEKPNTETTRKNGGSVNNVPACSFPVQSMNFSIIPPVNKHSDTQQQGSKDRFDLIPQPFALSFGSNGSTAPSLNFSSMAQNPSIFHGYKMAQQQLIQLQKHRMQQMQQVTGTASTPNTTPGSFIFSHVPVQTDNSSFPLPKSSQNQTHITFGNSSVPAASFQGQQIFINGQPSKKTGGSLRTGPTAGSTVSALPSQETDGSTQKSSPTCRRNVPSILSTCPSQLPELKY